jgi:hypothetical protein
VRSVRVYDNRRLARFEAKRARDERDRASAAFEAGSRCDFPIMEGRLFPASCDARH